MACASKLPTKVGRHAIKFKIPPVRIISKRDSRGTLPLRVRHSTAKVIPRGLAPLAIAVLVPLAALAVTTVLVARLIAATAL